jgi:hypothetical protein
MKFRRKFGMAVSVGDTHERKKLEDTLSQVERPRSLIRPLFDDAAGHGHLVWA